MGKLIREFEWSKTSLGPFDQWPQSLRTCVRIMLTSRQPIWIGWGKDLVKLYNDPYRAILGGKHPRALGQPASVVWKDIWPDIEPLLRKVMDRDEGSYMESQLLIMERNGYPEETYYTFSYTPIPGDHGGTAGMLCVNTDDTSRIIGERQLKTLQHLGNIETQHASLDEVYQAVVTALEKNGKDFPSVAIYRMYNHGIEARLVARSEKGAEDFPEQADLEQSAALGDAVRNREITLVTDGRQLLYIPITNAGDEYPQAVLVATLNPYRRYDAAFSQFAKLVSDQIAMEVNDVLAYEKERSRSEALAEIDRAKTIFFSNISHEFRTPLTLLLGPVEDALNDGATTPVNKDRLDIAHRNALRLQKLVNSLLDFSRIEAKRMQVDFERVDIAQLTRNIASSFESIMAKAGLEYIVDCPALPEAVAVDVDMWENIVLNLLSNAFKYTHVGKVTVRLTARDGGIGLSVADTGIGIPQEEQSKIFERFHRAENIRGRTQEGTGIGLSLVKELVKLHQGEIRLDSLPGKGSVFTVFIPGAGAGAGTETEVKASSNRKIAAFTEEAAKWVGEAPRVQSMGTAEMPRVLVVDDNADMREYIYRTLEGRFRVSLATDGAEAYEAVLRDPPDLILSDIMMPKMDGFAFLEATRRHKDIQHIPFIFLSARAGEEARLEGFQSGADDYLVKPFSGKELLVKTEACIRIARIRRATERNLYNLFMQTPVGIAVYTGPDLVIDLVNDAMLGYWDRRREDAIGTPLWELLPEAKTQGFDAIAAEVYRTGRSFTSPETPVQLWRGGRLETFYAQFAFEARRDELGNIIGLLGIANDVTEQVLARQSIEASEERYRELAGHLETLVNERTAELRSSNEDLQQFAHVASHDLKEPVRKMKIFGNRLKDEYGKVLPDGARTYLERMDAAAARMSAMIEGVLLYASLEAAELSIEQVNLPGIVEDIRADLEVMITEKHASIVYGDLPSFPGTRFLIYQLFYNLISNALKFSRAGVPPVIHIETAYAADGALCIVVRDNGIGFEQAYASDIFKTFSRLHSKDRYEGTGLGLALCRKIVERHRGKIRAEGQEGAGARFIITLPR